MAMSDPWPNDPILEPRRTLDPEHRSVLRDIAQCGAGRRAARVLGISEATLYRLASGAPCSATTITAVESRWLNLRGLVL